MVESEPARLLVYYDGGCPICTREINFYRSRPGTTQLEWVDVSGPDCQALGPGLTRTQALARMHVSCADGTLLSGAAAFAELWRRMPGFYWLGRLLAVPPFGALAEIGYRVFLRVRRLWR